MRDSTIFYRSFYEAIKDLPKDTKANIYDSIFEYALNFKEVEMNGIEKTIFTLIKPQLDANNKRWENGSKPKSKQDISKKKAKSKQDETESLANKNDNENNNHNYNDNEKDNVRNIAFENFWNYYKKGSKKIAKERFMKLTQSELERIKVHLPKYFKANPDIKFRKDAERYLSNKLWENNDDDLLEQVGKPITTNPTIFVDTFKPHR